MRCRQLLLSWCSCYGSTYLLGPSPFFLCRHHLFLSFGTLSFCVGGGGGGGSASLATLRFCCAFLTHRWCRRFSFFFHLFALVGSHPSIFGASAAWPSLLFFSLGLPWCWSSVPFCRVKAFAAAYSLNPFRRLLYPLGFRLLAFGIWSLVFHPLCITLVSCRLSLSFCFSLALDRMCYCLLAHPRFLSHLHWFAGASPFAAFLCLLLCCCFHCLLSLRLRRSVLFHIAQLPSSRVLPSLLGSWSSSLPSSYLLWLQFSLSSGGLYPASLSRFPRSVVFGSLCLSGLLSLGAGSSLPFCCALGSSSSLFSCSDFRRTCLSSPVLVRFLFWGFAGWGLSLSLCDSRPVPSIPFAAPSLCSSWLCLFLHSSGVSFCIGVSSCVHSSSFLGVFVPLAFSTLALWLVLVSSAAVCSLFFSLFLCALGSSCRLLLPRVCFVSLVRLPPSSWLGFPFSSFFYP